MVKKKGYPVTKALSPFNTDEEVMRNSITPTLVFGKYGIVFEKEESAPANPAPEVPKETAANW